jgi:hypothetical protein
MDDPWIIKYFLIIHGRSSREGPWHVNRNARAAENRLPQWQGTRTAPTWPDCNSRSGVCSGLGGNL